MARNSIPSHMMIRSSPLLHLLAFCLLFLHLLGAAVALDKVPLKDQFKHVNTGDFVDYPAEYGATYRAVPVVGSPFQLAFYNTTPGAYTLAIRMGTPRSGSIRRWVWEANPGRPVGENATISLGADGNLVLAEADGTVVWSTGTANRGVVGIEILRSGNMVLRDRKGRFIWQSFDYPTDTLLVGQTLPCRGANRLVSRKSESDGSPGRYSLGVDRSQPVLFVGVPPARQLVYYNGSREYNTGRPGNSLTFDCFSSDDNVTYNLGFGILNKYTKYDSSLSLMRLTPDGDVVFYTYDDRVSFGAWEKTFALFDPELRDLSTSACYKPSRCGSLGVCTNDMCSACPTPKGPTGWSRTCAPPKRGGCKAGGNQAAGYFKVTGVEHFLTRYTDGEGKMSVGECRRRCSADCDCLGFLYWEESSRCWLTPLLGTLDKVHESKHVVYIKSS